MKKYRWLIIIVNLIALLLFVNNRIVKKESILSDGQLILLELDPISTQSMIQGYYMDLRYSQANDINLDSIPKRGYCIVRLNQKGIADKVRYQKERIPLNKDEILIEYSTTSWNINIGAPSYFFEEGEDEKYKNAKYGGIMVDEQGNSILIGLYDTSLVMIE